jgi:thiopeptide-type bacteriocin biosynthesis protein
VAGVSPWSRRGYLEAIRFEPYQPEVERYGGPEGLGLAERWFHQDSVLVGRWLAGDPPDDDALPRRAAVAAIDGLLGDWLVPAGHRTPLLDRLLHRLALDGPATSRLRREVGQLVRDRTGGREPRRAGGRAWRSAPLREIAAAFRALDRHGRLRVAIGSVIEDLVHLRLNRLLLGEAREDEALAIAGLRARYTSSRARRSAASRDSAEAVE